MKHLMYLSISILCTCLWFLCILSILLVSFPGRANADDEVLIAGAALAALGTTIVVPLVGLGIDKASGRENSPYLPAVVFTVVASSAGAVLAMNRFDGRVSSRGKREAIGFPLLFGSVTTVLVYTLWPRSNDTASKEFKQNVPRIALAPTKDGGFIGFSWQF